MLHKSDNINELAAALVLAQGKLKAAVKDSSNPHFKSKYADLASVWDACRDALQANGLAVTQLPFSEDGLKVGVVTILTHKSGQWIAGKLVLSPVKTDPQAAGSAITYARRYGLAAIVGVVADDDDGNAASGGGQQWSRPSATTARSGQIASSVGKAANLAPSAKKAPLPNQDDFPPEA